MGLQIHKLVWFPLQFAHIRDFRRCQIDKQMASKPIELSKYVKSFNCPSFLEARVQVNFMIYINLDLVDKLAASCWDCQLPLFLRYGFPMDFRGSHLDLMNDGSCHALARDNPEHVNAYIIDEIETQAHFLALLNINLLGKIHISLHL